MARDKKSVDYDALIRRHKPPAARAADRAESVLEALLEQHAQETTCEPGEKHEPVTPLDKLRVLFKNELIQVVQELGAKYETSGIQLELDAERFLQGGCEIAIIIEFSGCGVRLDGIILSGSIAFNKTRYGDDISGGVVGSGPTLRVRTLTADSFRQFVCDQTTHLVQAALRRR